jgi:hypothetical protein
VPTPKKTRRPSRAEVKRRQVEAKQRTEQRVLPADLRAYIDSYNPKNPDGRPMDVIRPFIIEVLTLSEIRGTNSTKYHCTHLTELAAYALTRGLPVSIKTVLTTDLIEEYISIGMAGSDANKRARRMLLLNLARNVNPGPTAPATLTPIPRVAIRPCYSPAEMATIRRVIVTQPTKARVRDLCTAVALGAGAGADSMDVRHLYIRHINDRGDDGIWVAFQEPRPRTIPVRAQYEVLLRKGLDGRRPDELVIGHTEDRNNLTAGVFERAILHNAPELAQARLRATWLADLMTDSVPLALILQAAGLKSARSLVDLMPHVDPWLAHRGIVLPGRDEMDGAQR